MNKNISLIKKLFLFVIASSVISHLINSVHFFRFFSVKQVNYRSIITSVFDGKLLSSVQCLTCNRVGYAAEASPKPCGTSQIEPFVKIVNDEKPLIISHLRCLAEFWIDLCIIVLRNLMFVKYKESSRISLS